MKIKQEHFDHLKTTIDAFLARPAQANIVDDYEHGNFIRSDKVKDLQTRFCYDILYNAGLTSYVCNTLYKYMNDTHIYTALKKICPKVERKY